MWCRHTVADWRRYLQGPEALPPMFAACRLVVSETEPAADYRAITCGFWGRQEECPFFESAAGGPRRPRRQAESLPGEAGEVAARGMPLVAVPSAKPSVVRSILIVLAAAGLVLLLWALVMGDGGPAGGDHLSRPAVSKRR